MSDSLKRVTIRNIGYNSVAKVIQLVVMAAANIILTRTLAPSDYGIVGFALIFITFLTQFSDLGIGSAAIQKKELTERELSTAFTLKFVIGLVIFVLASLAAPLAVRFFDNPAIVNVIRVLAFSFVLNTFWFLPNVLLTRALEYKKIALVNLIAAICNSVTAIVLALMGFNYWSLVAASLVLSVVTALLINYSRPVAYHFAWSKEAACGFIRFGSNIFINGLIVFLIYNADNFLIGSVKGSSCLGYYTLAFNWASMTCTLISSTILSVLFPTFSRMQDDRGRLKESYLTVLAYVSFGGVMLVMTLMVVSRDFLVQVLGHGTNKWLPALTSLRILCFYGMFRILLEPVGQVMVAIGRTDGLRKAAFVVMLMEVGGLYPVLQFFGLEGVAVLVTVAYLSQYVVYFRILKVELLVRPGDLLEKVYPALLAAVPLLLIFLYGENAGKTSLSLLAIKLTSCIVVYLVCYGLITRWRLFKEIRGMVQGPFRRSL